MLRAKMAFACAITTGFMPRIHGDLKLYTWNAFFHVFLMHFVIHGDVLSVAYTVFFFFCATPYKKEQIVLYN